MVAGALKGGAYFQDNSIVGAGLSEVECQADWKSTVRAKVHMAATRR